MGFFDKYQNDFMKGYKGYKQPKYTNKPAKEKEIKSDNENKPLPNFFQKRGLTQFSPETQKVVDKLKSNQLYGGGFKWFNTLATGAKNDGTAYKVSFLNDLVDQNYALIHELDQQKQQNEKLIQQNDEIISLLKTIAKAD